MDSRLVILRETDNVATALAPLKRGEAVHPHGPEGAALTLRDDIDFGHKLALAAIARGGDVLKYGEVIGAASRDIAPGEHVHVHNMESRRGRGDQSRKKAVRQ